ncbi:hypothetical protein AAFC00_003870 [Neodothiora populina]|uniref:Protein BIG1 n=1 Tax=Neodothiora populina TaxID=2781224 RepID=A0ABR3PFM4_9PEZI
MHTRYFGAAALALQCAHAFRDASPFFLFSTNELDINLEDAKVASHSTIESKLRPLVEGCSSGSIVFVSQPGVSGADYAAHRNTPYLERRLVSSDKQIKTAAKISNAVGLVDDETVYHAVNKYCTKNAEGWSSLRVDGADGKIPKLEKKSQSIRLTFSAPSADQEERATTLARHDSFLNDILTQLDSYTVVYTTTPATTQVQEAIQHPEQTYEMDSPFPPGMHGDLKRDLSGYEKGSNGSNLDSNLPLFEKYQFVNQGIFITGSVSLLLLLILSVGVSAIANLDVSYMAFSKEMGPAAQKKQ